MNPIKRLKMFIQSYPDKAYIDWIMKRQLLEINNVSRAPELSRNIIYRTETGVTSTKCCNEELIITLSTFGDRIHGTAITIESLLEQSVKPNRIILNLGRQFEGKGRIPGSLKLLERRGLEIRFSRDIGPYTKLLPTLKDYPNAAIITVDDDIIYDYDMVSNLVNEHITHPNEIIASRCRVMETKGSKLLSSFLSWKFAPNGSESSIKLLPEGAMGILYPPHSMDERVFDEKIFLDLCPSTDDFWFKAMGMLKGTIVRKAYSECDDVRNSKSSKTKNLYDINKSGGYDRQLQAVLSHFELYPWLDNHHKTWLEYTSRD
ncbi:MAG: hypothetical protein NC212_05125 [Staphylococcus sp.]|nr:hypothetical protein [Staphylococcus sp.]